MRTLKFLIALRIIDAKCLNAFSYDYSIATNHDSGFVAEKMYIDWDAFKQLAPSLLKDSIVCLNSRWCWLDSFRATSVSLGLYYSPT